MKYTREQFIDVARKFVEGEITASQGQEILQIKKSGFFYWVRQYRELIGETIPINPKSKKAIKSEADNEDEISRLSSLSKEELIDEVIKAKVGEARAKKGYEVKGGGGNKEYVILNNKNIK